MASAVLSRFLPPAAGEPSIYETLRQQDDESEQSSLGSQADMVTNEDGGKDSVYRDHDIDIHGIPNRPAPQPDPAGRPPLPHHAQGQGTRQRESTGGDADDPDNEVPQSLLIEEDQDVIAASSHQQRPLLPPPVPGPSNQSTRTRWQATQREQQLHQDSFPPRSSPRQATSTGRPLGLIDPRERATWMWANVDNLDGFLHDVYQYYTGHGIWSILLSRAVRLLTLAFIVAFTTFLTSCVDFRKVPESKTMSQILIPQCTKTMSGSASVLLWLFTFFWVFKIFDYCRDIRRLRSMQGFYRHLLEIPDSDMQTVSWQEVVKKLMQLRDLNPTTAAGLKQHHRRFMGSQSKQRMDAHDIANRLMRRDNYLIALINKDVLDFTLPLPFLRNRQLFSRTLEWNLQYCILDFVFNEQGQVRSLFLKDTHRQGLSDGFRSRFLFAGFISLLCAPFIVLYYMLFYFFRYFTEYQRNPSQIGSRQYTPFAEWKFREFNELQHLFERRINMSYPFASRYVDQFPKDKTIQISGLVAFVTGALASVLAVASLIDPESFLAFEITPERTVLFYLGVFGTIWAVARGNVPEDNLVFDPEYALSNVTEYTHYMPSHWKGRLHTNEVRTDFTQLYQMKVYIFWEEILSIILAPLVLWFSLPKCCDRLVDFFREFTVHVDGMGYVCSFAVFDFKKGGSNVARLDDAAARDLREEYYSTKDGKMLASYYGFIDNYITNQRPGAPFTHPANKQSFHAPPTFPGLMSPTLAGEAPMSSRYGPSDRYKNQQRSVFSSSRPINQSVQKRTPRFALAGSHPSPVASVLLDPQHQPSNASMKRAKKADGQRRMRTSHAPLSYPDEDEEGVIRSNAPGSADNTSEGPGDESNLGESWKTTQAGIGNGRHEGTPEDINEDRAPGVLGLVYQFSKAQTDGRPGVNI